MGGSKGGNNGGSRGGSIGRSTINDYHGKHARLIATTYDHTNDQMISRLISLSQLLSKYWQYTTRVDIGN